MKIVLISLACLCGLVCLISVAVFGQSDENTRRLKGCFHLDSRVAMADGTSKRLGNISTGDIVLSWSPQGRSSSRVVEVLRLQRDNIADIILETGSRIQTTLDHPFWSHRLQGLVSLDPETTK